MEESHSMKTNLKDKKIFKKPELEIIDFTNEDIITDSGFGITDPDDPGDVLQN